MRTLFRSLLLASWGCLGWIGALVLLPCYKPAGAAWWHEGVLWVPVKRLLPSWAKAQCWGLVVFYQGDRPSARTIRHEDRHSTQWAFLGLLFPVCYGLGHLIGGGYLNNWFERDARDAS